VKLYEITIKPVSGFGTPLKGDTLFGHFCWQAAYDPKILNGGIDKWIACYGEKPFAVFSTAWPKLCENGEWFYAVKRPDIPLTHIFSDTYKDKRKSMEARKANARKKWILIPNDLHMDLSPDRFKSDDDILKIVKREATGEIKKYIRGKSRQKFLEDFNQAHNTINRETSTTGVGMFAPYAQTATFYYPETQLAVFVLVDEEATDIERVFTALARIGQFGYGRDASTGCGRYDMGNIELREIPNIDNADACYTLAPSIPKKSIFRQCYFSPFTRFGRHGDILARSSNPFKNPVIMIDEGAVLIPNDISTIKTPYFGRPALNVSKVISQAVTQGYTPWLPFKMEKQA